MVRVASQSADCSRRTPQQQDTSIVQQLSVDKQVLRNYQKTTSEVDGGWEDQPYVRGPEDTEEITRGVIGMPSPLTCSRSARGTTTNVAPPERQKYDHIHKAGMSDEQPHLKLIEAVVGGTQAAPP